MDQTADGNEFQLDIIAIVFQVLDLVVTFITGVLLPGIMTPFFTAFSDLFSGTA